MSERAYTVSEIDRMRAALQEIEPQTGQIWVSSSNLETEARYNAIYAQKNAAYASIIEDRLRTYMLGGIDPAEIEALADEKKREREAKWKEREALALSGSSSEPPPRIIGTS